MNILEQLSNANKKNYLRYLDRMTQSMKNSTKGLIPIMCHNKNNILDVGCGSGVLMDAIEKENPKSIITGIDLNKESIAKLKELNKNWKLYHMDLLKMPNQKYDAIIFSSVLHEISSYNSDEKKKFTKTPINEILKKTNELLETDGSIILRDGLMIDKDKYNKRVIISFSNQEETIWLNKFQNDFRGFDKLDIKKIVRKIDDNTYEVGLAFLKEFLYTYTWGSSSYPREVQERYGILDKEDWINILEANGFEIETIVESKEEYEKYLSPKVNITYPNGNKFIYPMMTILIKAKKNKTLIK